MNQSNGVLLDEPRYEDYQPFPPEDEATDGQSDDLPQKAQPDEPIAERPKITQAEAMRLALLELGTDAKNANLAEFIASNFGLSPKNISVLKSTVKQALRGPQESAEPIQEQQPADPDLDGESNGRPIQTTAKLEPMSPEFSIEEVEAVKRLCDRIGANTLLGLLTILGI